MHSAISPTEIAYFGKPGSFSHLVAQKVAASQQIAEQHLTPCETVHDVFHHTQRDPSRLGVVPIENSSAGMIESTIDHLINERGPLQILGEYALNVRLALLAKNHGEIRLISSHFAPLQHCELWLKEHYPGVATEVSESTSSAAHRASLEPGVAAIAPLSSAARYALETVQFPIGGNIKNLTQFFLMGHPACLLSAAESTPRETSLAAVLKNQVGSLCKFLTPFADFKINLKRIKSLNVYGQPNTYVFFVGIESNIAEPAMTAAMESAGQQCHELRLLGSYPVHPSFDS